MERIRNIHDLEYEKLKLRVKQLELEKQMSQSWKHVSKTLTANREPKHSSQDNINFKTGSPLLTNLVNHAASFLSHKMGIIGGKKIESSAEQMLEKLAVKLNSFVWKKKSP
jgi:hypothetical protein